MCSVTFLTRRLRLTTALLATACFLLAPFHAQASSTLNRSDIRRLAINTPNLTEKVLSLAVTAHDNARAKGHTKKDILTVVDYSLASTKERLFVIDLNKKKVIHKTVVAHGAKSGDNYAKNFSNTVNSHASSLGVFLTKNAYHGKHGYALRLQGLEKNFNDNAFKRAIVMHSAWYAEKAVVKKLKRLGRSFGCFAIPTSLNKPIIDTIKNNTLIVAYYPDKKWLRNSAFLS